MSKRKVKRYPNDFKAKVVLEALKGEQTLSQIASNFRVDPRNIQYWKKEFLDNMELVFDKERAVSSYKEQLKDKEQRIDELYRQNGKLNLLLEWAKKKSKEYGLPYPQGDDCFGQAN